MRYNGKIKATFAELYYEDGQKLCSIQKADANNAVLVTAEKDELNEPNELGLVHVFPTNELLTIVSKCFRPPLRGTILGGMEEQGVYVKPIAFEWASQDKSNANKGLLTVVVLLAGAIFLTSK